MSSSHDSSATNTTRQALELTDSSTNDQADDDRQAHLETLSADNARLRAELNNLRAQLICATSQQCETLYNASHNASLPTKQVTTSTNRLHHSGPADTTMSSASTQSPSLNDGTNQDAERPATPTISTHEGEPSMAQILTALVNTQALLANSLSRALAHWTPSLTLVTAASRLTRSAKDWHSAYSSQHDTWEQWKEALTPRFKRKLTMQDGINDDTWANPLAAQLCGTVTELIDRAALLDGRRRMTVCVDNNKEPPPRRAVVRARTSRHQPASLPTCRRPNRAAILRELCARGPPLLATGKSSSSEVPPLKQGPPHGTGETLIAPLCWQSNESVSKDDGFLSDRKPVLVNPEWRHAYLPGAAVQETGPLNNRAALKPLRTNTVTSVHSEQRNLEQKLLPPIPLSSEELRPPGYKVGA
ncbi:hypothetical protein HPB52_005394 [Rhipicephalus sanguineus]|uniref:Uncharacterized protein n=1 Tax=Rhipicephalus sanguineus TaxID=34632 RepID=A0A9D4T014_RHISA|nr:hypothetical protein HPB52_005394 [Rhipicephalus sanguineus]